MPDNDNRDLTVTELLSRRRLLSLAGAGVVGSLAGCDGGSGGGDGTPTAEPTGTPTATPTDAPTPTDTPTATPEPVYERHVEDGGEFDIVVAQDGSGDFETVQAAIDSVPDESDEETRIKIEPGRYREKLDLPEEKQKVTFVGDDPEETVLFYDDHADKTDESGEEIGTTGSSSMFLWGDDFTAKNVTFANEAEDVAQAVALRVDGDRAAFVNCRFLGNQDTLYPHGRDSRQYYRDCYVEGDVDFIFGWATCLFENCEIFCKDQGYVTAASTEEQKVFGFVFKNCDVVGDAPTDSVYLGRPWRPYANVVFMHSHLGDVIHPEGWDNWGDREKEDTAFFAEYRNEGPGYTPSERVLWSHQLDQLQADYSTTSILDGWDPEEELVE